jgi:hypothetical protein
MRARLSVLVLVRATLHHSALFHCTTHANIDSTIDSLFIMKLAFIASVFAFGSFAQQNAPPSFNENVRVREYPPGIRCLSDCPSGSKCVVSDIICDQQEGCPGSFAEFCDPVNGPKPAVRRATVVWNMFRDRNCGEGTCPPGYRCLHTGDYCIGTGCTTGKSVHCILQGVNLKSGM